MQVGNTGVLKAFAVHSAFEHQRSAVIDTLLRGAFAALPELDHLLCVLSERSTHGSSVHNRNFIQIPGLPGVFICPRQNILPTMFVRNARVEDFDDLVPVFDAQSEVVTSGFGQYFLAEVIEARDREHAALVGEGPSGHAVGLMAATSSSSEVRLPLLQSSFDLSAFGHLVKPDASVEAVGARAAQLEARMQCDWYSVLAAHADELESLFDSLPVVNDRHDGVPVLITPAGQAPPPPSREAVAEAIATGKPLDTNVLPEDSEAVFVSDVVSLFDAKGDAWGFIGVCGVRLGTQMMADLGLQQVQGKRRTAVTRNALNTAVEDFASRRERMHMRQRVAGWYTYVPPTATQEAGGVQGADGAGLDTARPGSAALQSPVSSKPAPAAAAYSGPPPGRKLVTEEFDKLEAARNTERKDTLRAAQQAVTAAQKEVDACSAADRAAHEAALKEKAEREAAERKAAGAKAGSKKPDAAASGSSLYKPPPVPKSAATTAAEGKLEAAQKAVLTAQAALTAPLRVPLVALAAAVNLRLIGDGVPASSGMPAKPAGALHGHHHHHQHSHDMQHSTADLHSIGGPAAEFLLDATAYLAEAKAAVASDQAPPGTKSPPADASDGSLASTPNPSLTKPVFQALLQLWEQRALPAVTSRVITVTSVCSSTHYAMRSYGSADAVPACTAGEEATAACASTLLQLPRLHLPSFFTSAAAAYAEQERLRAEEEVKRKEAAEKRRKKEEEEKKKELMAGKAPPSKEDKAKEKKPTEAPREDKNLLLDPSTNPCGALLQHLKKHEKFAAGVILTGLPVHDAQACEELRNALDSAQLPIVINLHASETPASQAASQSRPSSARPGSAATGGSKPLVRLPSGRVSQDRASVFAEERLMQGALQRRNSFAQLSDSARAFAADAHAHAATASPLTLLAGHSKSSPWSSTVGHVVHVDADEAHLTEESLRRQGKAHRGSGVVEPAAVKALLREHLLGMFLREGMLSLDPTAPAGEAAGATAKDLHQAYIEALLREDGNMARPSNAFAITLYCLDTRQESRSVDLLAAAFEAFPDREYCILTQPHSAPDLPLLRRFVRVPSKPSTTLDAVLYVCHRDSLLAPALVTVRRATKADRPVITGMTRSLPDAQQFMDAIVASEYRAHQPLSPVLDADGVLVEPAARIASFAVEVEGTVVGCVVLTNTGAEGDAVRAAAISYDLDKHMSVAHYLRSDGLTPVSCKKHSADGAAHVPPTAVGCLLHMVVAPTFLPASPFILRTALRLYGNKFGALYRQQRSALGPHIAAPLPPVVREHMCLVAPRRLPELNPADAAVREKMRAERGADKAEHVGQMDCITLAAYTVAGLSRSELADPRSLDQGLYVFSARSSVSRRTHVNARVVLVGASDAALSAMASLLLEPSVQLNNLIVISPGGLPRPSDAFSHPAPFVPGREYSAFELSRLPLSSHITVVDDVVMAIQRKERSVTLQGSVESTAPSHAGFGHGASMGGAPRLVTSGAPSMGSKSQGSHLFASAAGGARAKVRYDALLLLPGLTEATWSKLKYPAPEAVPRGMHCLTHAEALASLASDVDALASEIEAIQAAGQVPLASAVSEAAVDIAGEGIAQCTDVDVAVYGEGLEALTAINALLDRGIPGHHIVHLRPCKRAFEAHEGASGSAGAALAQDASASALPPVAVDVLDDLLPLASSGPRSAPLSADGVFTSSAVASVLAAAGVRTILGAEIIGVGGSMAAAAEAGIGLNMSSLGEEDSGGLGGASSSLHVGSVESGRGGVGVGVGVAGGVEGGASLGGEDALPSASIPGLSIDLRLRRLPVPAVPGSEGAEGTAEASTASNAGQDLDQGGGFDDEPPPEAPPPPPQVETVTIPAALLLCAADRDVDPRFFKAVDDSGIVYDGRLVLSHTFNATDPAVFGGGSVAKFSRRYRTEVPLSKYDSREVGAAVAASVLHYLRTGGRPTGSRSSSNSAPSPSPEMLPAFAKPKVTRAVLPGNLYYVRARLPLAVHGDTGMEVVTFVAPQLERGIGMRYWCVPPRPYPAPRHSSHISSPSSSAVVWSCPAMALSLSWSTAAMTPWSPPTWPP